MSLLTPPNRSLFYQRGDASDPRLGEFVEAWTESADVAATLAGAHAALVGWPDDRGIALNKGRLGAGKGPDEIRRAFYRCTLGTNYELRRKRIVDIGNLELDADLSSSHEKAAQVVEMLVKEDVIPIVLGGGNDYAFADVLGLRRAVDPRVRIGVINVDAHLDVRDISRGLTSGTPYYRLLEASSPIVRGSDFVEYGIQPHHNSADHLSYVQKMGAKVFDLQTIQKKGVENTFVEALGTLAKTCERVVVSLDIDSVKMSDAPGCSASYPNGLCAADVESIARWAGKEKKVTLFSVYEVSPDLDTGGRTSALAASAIWYFLSESLSREK